MDSIQVNQLVKQRIRVRLVTLGAQLYRIIQTEDELKKGELEGCIARCNQTLDGITGVLEDLGIKIGGGGVISAIRGSLEAITENDGYKNITLNQDIYANEELKGLVKRNINSAYSAYEKMKELIS